jgi:threonine dehydratase
VATDGDLLGAGDFDRAAARIGPLVEHTPLRECATLSDRLRARVLVKAENLQHTGSFKIRGVLNALLTCREQGDLPAGIATYSAGNHAAAVSYATTRLGIPAVVCMPPAAVASKVAAVRRYGGEIVFTDDLVGACGEVIAERGYRLLHPFDDRTVIAGHGTVGLEILTDSPAPDLVLVPVGGGGLISGVATAIKTRSPGTRVVGVEPLGANAMSYALRRDAPEPLPQRPKSIADGLTAPFAGRHTLAHVKAFVDDVIELDDQPIVDAWWPLMDATKLLLEPSAVVGLAAILDGAVSYDEGSTIVLVLSGGNTGPENLRRLTPDPPDPPARS